MRSIEVQVLIVGGGGTGLSAAIFLADLGIDALLVERHAGTSHLPKSHYVNQRSMEIFRRHGVAEDIYARAAPRRNMGKILWRTSLGGDGPVDGKTLVSLDVMGGGGLQAAYDEKGAAAPAHLPQSRLEPILLQAALARNPNGVRFHHELIAFSQSPDGVRAVVRDLDAGEDFEVLARYMIAADAGKTVGPALGVTMVGVDNVASYVSAHISADLSAYAPEDDAVMRVIFHPRQTAMGVGALLTFGPDRWDGGSREWGVSWVEAPTDDPDDSNMADRIREFLKVDAPIEVHRISRWALGALIADSFQSGRIFLAGDAAHKHAPTGGLGLNSGIQDAHNLCWKLALTLNGLAGPGLPQTYEAERRPVVTDNASRSLFGNENHRIAISSLGITPGQPEESEAQVAALLADTPEGERRRARMREVFRVTRGEYGGHDQELGFGYVAGALVDDGSPPAPRDPMGAEYTPTTRPGRRLPHVWLEADGRRVSTHDLGALDGFLLIAGPAGQAWTDAAHIAAQRTRLPIRAVRIGGAGAEIADPDGAWAAVRDFGEEGAVLVRPDGHVAWRAAGADADPLGAIEAALDAVCARVPQPG